MPQSGQSSLAVYSRMHYIFFFGGHLFVFASCHSGISGLCPLRCVTCPISWHFMHFLSHWHLCRIVQCASIHIFSFRCIVAPSGSLLNMRLHYVCSFRYSFTQIPFAQVVVGCGLLSVFRRGFFKKNPGLCLDNFYLDLEREPRCLRPSNRSHPSVEGVES